MGIFKKKRPFDDRIPFDVYPCINLIVSGTYLEGVAPGEIHRLEISLDTCVSYRQIVKDFAKQSYPQEKGESVEGYEYRVEELTRGKVKIFLVLLASVSQSDKNRLRGIEERYKHIRPSIDAYDPKDPALLSPDLEDTVYMIRYKFAEDLFLRIGPGVQIQKGKLESLFRSLSEYTFTNQLPRFSGNGYRLSRGLR